MARSTDDYATPNWKKGKVKSDRPNQPQTSTPTAPKWNRPGAGRKRDEEESRPSRYDPAGAGGYDPTKAVSPAWLSNTSNWIKNTAAWYDANPYSSSHKPNPAFQTPTTGTGSGMINPFRGANAGAGMKPNTPALNPPAGEGYHWEGNVRVKDTTGLTMNPLNYRPRWSNGLAPAGEAGRPFQPSVTGFNFTPSNTGGGSGGGYGSGYGSGGGGGGGGGGYSYPTSPARVPTWLMNLYNWNFKG